MATVLLATDGSDLATAAMTRGVSLLGKGHDFVALHVVPPAFVPAAPVSPMDAHPTVVDPELEHQLETEDKAESSAELHDLAELLDLDLHSRVEIGDPGQVICTIAKDIAADVIVVGSHGHGWFQRVLIGSVSNHVLNHAPCPVLVIRLEEIGEPVTEEHAG